VRDWRAEKEEREIMAGVGGHNAEGGGERRDFFPANADNPDWVVVGSGGEGAAGGPNEDAQDIRSRLRGIAIDVGCGGGGGGGGGGPPHSLPQF